MEIGGALYELLNALAASAFFLLADIYLIKKIFFGKK
jgi:hypothetical protein